MAEVTRRNLDVLSIDDDDLESESHAYRCLANQ